MMRTLMMMTKIRRTKPTMSSKPLTDFWNKPTIALWVPFFVSYCK